MEIMTNLDRRCEEEWETRVTVQAGQTNVVASLAGVHECVRTSTSRSEELAGGKRAIALFGQLDHRHPAILHYKSVLSVLLTLPAKLATPTDFPSRRTTRGNPDSIFISSRGWTALTARLGHREGVERVQMPLQRSSEALVSSSGLGSSSTSQLPLEEAGG